MQLAGPHRPPASGGAPDSLIVMLHGRGANGDDLIGLADFLSPALPNVAFHSPNAPNPLPEGGPASYQWYQRDPTEDRLGGLHAIEPVVNEFIDGLLEDTGLEASRCVLLGFSQGSIVSIHTAPRRSSQVAGVVAFSGAMITGDTLAKELASRPPFVLIHGTEDQVLPVGGTEAAGRAFEEVGVPVSVHLLPDLAHGIDRRGLDIAADFIRSVLPPL